jgi:hypothetical protein
MIQTNLSYSMRQGRGEMRQIVSAVRKGRPRPEALRIGSTRTPLAARHSERWADVHGMSAGFLNLAEEEGFEPPNESPR